MVKPPCLSFSFWIWAYLAQDLWTTDPFCFYCPSARLGMCVSPCQILYPFCFSFVFLFLVFCLFCSILKACLYVYGHTWEQMCIHRYGHEWGGLTLMQNVFSCSPLYFWGHGLWVEPRAGWSIVIASQLALPLECWEYSWLYICLGFLGFPASMLIYEW